MKKFEINYSCPITKTNRSKIVNAEDKRKARKKFNDMWYNPYPIISINLIKEEDNLN